MKLVEPFSDENAINVSPEQAQLAIAHFIEKNTVGFTPWEKGHVVDLFLMGYVFDDVHDVQVELNDYTVSLYQPNGVVVGGLSFFVDPDTQSIDYHILDAMKPETDEDMAYYSNLYALWAKIAIAATTLRNQVPMEFWNEGRSSFSAQSDDWTMYQLWRLYPQYREDRFKDFPDYIKQGLRERPGGYSS